jgi:hypothetical protein
MKYFYGRVIKICSQRRIKGSKMKINEVQVYTIGKVKNKFTFPIRSLIHLNIFSFVRKFFREKL